jgi:hypothetical protein
VSYDQKDDTNPNNIPLKGVLQQRWTELDTARGALKARCEEYAGWTLPYIFPQDNIKDVENQGPLDSIGARAVNGLSNKVVSTMFTPYRPFVRLEATDEFASGLAQKTGEKEAADALASVDATLAKVEKAGMKYLDKVGFRAEAITAAKSLIIVGNSLMYLPENGKAQVYSLKDFCVLRDLNGVVVEIMTRDGKAFETFSEEVRSALVAGGHKYEGNHPCKVYTRIKLMDDGKYHVHQHVEDVPLTTFVSYTTNELPWIPLVWNLNRGEDYGRGLVEDYAGAFHACWILMEALVVGAAAAADIKILVDPSSVLDVDDLNKSKSGSYHAGREGDLTYPKVDKQSDFQLVTALLDRFEKQISQGFLLNTTRDAERVTAEEIRRDANELEESLGGIYSRLSEIWQNPVARLTFARIDFKLYDERTITFRIITGMDSLSRQGDLDNLQMFIQDLNMLDAVPEEFRAWISPPRFMQVVGTARGVEYMKFLKTEDEKRAEEQQQQQMLQQQANAQAQAQAAGGVAKAAATS